jgi:hypothetical protein
LAKLAAMNRLGKAEEWEFNEWFHGLSGRPMGYGHQSWSAALYLFAHDAVRHGRVRFINIGGDTDEHRSIVICVQLCSSVSH